jgi:hypothetical protein
VLGAGNEAVGCPVEHNSESRLDLEGSTEDHSPGRSACIDREWIWSPERCEGGALAQTGSGFGRRRHAKEERPRGLGAAR